MGIKQSPELPHHVVVKASIVAFIDLSVREAGILPNTVRLENGYMIRVDRPNRIG